MGCSYRETGSCVYQKASSVQRCEILSAAQSSEIVYSRGIGAISYWERCLVITDHIAKIGRGAVTSSMRELAESLNSLVPAFRARATREEDMRRLSDETVADLRGSGILHMHVPAAYGGLELGLEEHFHAARIVARGAVSTSWVASFLAQGCIYARKLDPKAQRRIFETPDFTGICGSNQAHPGSGAQEVDGGYLVSGRWSFASGVHHSSWAVLSVPYQAAPGAPATRLFFLVPKIDLEIGDVWYTAGMRATGSEDIMLRDYFVPRDQALLADAFIGGGSPGQIADPDNELVRCPVFRIAALSHPAYTLGAAERSLEIFAEEVLPKRQRYWGGGALKDSSIVHLRYAYAVRDFHVADLLAKDMVARTVKGLRESYSLEDRAHITLMSASSIEAAGAVVKALVRQSGGSIHFTGKELERINRDMSVLLNHSTGDIDYAAESTGRVLLGQGLGKRIDVFF
jgi:GTP cyclohydrolase II